MSRPATLYQIPYPVRSAQYEKFAIYTMLNSFLNKL